MNMKKHITQFYRKVKLEKRSYLFKTCMICALMCCSVVRANASTELTEIRGEQQSGVVKGIVTDSKGEAMPGVVVQVKGTTKAVMTDIDGNFELDGLAGNETIAISSIGMKSQEIKLNGQTFLDVKLQDDVVGLEDVVVLGYTSMKKKDLTRFCCISEFGSD